MTCLMNISLRYQKKFLSAYIQHSYTQSNQLQLKNVLAIVFTEVQITICGIHYQVMVVQEL